MCLKSSNSILLVLFRIIQVEFLIPTVYSIRYYRYCMATTFGNSDWLWNEAEELINNSFNRIIDEVNNRRERVLTSLRDIRDIVPKFMRSIEQLEDQINKIEGGMTENLLYSTKKSIISDLKKRISEIHVEARCAEFDYQFVFDDTELKRALSALGSFEKYPKYYSEKKFPKFSFECELKDTGRFSVNEELGLIALNDRHEKKIIYFDLTSGKCISSFKLESYPAYAIEIFNKQEIALSGYHLDSIIMMQFNPRDKIQAKLISKTTVVLETITSLSCDNQSDRIYAVSSPRHCIAILDRKLAVLEFVSLDCTFPQSIYVTGKEIYILDCGNPCLHIFSKSTRKIIRSIIPQGIDLHIDICNCFAVDKDCNIIIPVKNRINIFSPSGQLLRSFPVNQNLDSVYQPTGVFVTDRYEIILLSYAPKYPIQIF